MRWTRVARRRSCVTDKEPPPHTTPHTHKHTLLLLLTHIYLANTTVDLHHTCPPLLCTHLPCCFVLHACFPDTHTHVHTQWLTHTHTQVRVQAGANCWWCSGWNCSAAWPQPNPPECFVTDEVLGFKLWNNCCDSPSSVWLKLWNLVSHVLRCACVIRNSGMRTREAEVSPPPNMLHANHFSGLLHRLATGMIMSPPTHTHTHTQHLGQTSAHRPGHSLQLSAL